MTPDAAPDGDALDALALGCCPMCGVRFDAPDTSRCDHEAGWYREWLALLTAGTEGRLA